MTVHCFNDECAHYESGACKCSEIFISDEGCDNYVPYTDTLEYGSEYWACVLTEDKRTRGRAKKIGKRIVINDREFFTESDTRRDDEYVCVTDARTGLRCGNLRFLKYNWEKYVAAAEKIESVTSYPLCVYDDTKRAYVIQEG